jgi:hypothetical protein
MCSLFEWRADVDLMAFWKPSGTDVIYVHFPREFTFELQRAFGERYVSEKSVVIGTLVRAEFVGGGLASIYPCSHQMYGQHSERIAKREHLRSLSLIHTVS